MANQEYWAWFEENQLLETKQCLADQATDMVEGQAKL
jgi:hypothetical protein